MNSLGTISNNKVSNIRSAARFRQTVLLIDDQMTALDIHRAILKSLKLKLDIVAMTNPVEALAWMQNKQVDLIITDLRMPQMDGLQFVQMVNSMDDGIHRPIIVVTVLKDKQTHQMLVAAGASACLAKPAPADELAKVAKTLLAQSKCINSQS